MVLYAAISAAPMSCHHRTFEHALILSSFCVQIRNFGGSGYKMCIDSAAKRGDMHKPVGLYPCHNQGGNQVISSRCVAVVKT